MTDTATDTRPAQKRCGRVGRSGSPPADLSWQVQAPSPPSAGTSDAEISGIDAERARRLAKVPAKYRNLYRRAYAAKSRKAAIRAQCLECCGWSADEVRRCTAPACPLYEFRLRG